MRGIFERLFGLRSEILILGRTVAEPILGESPMLEMAGVDAANVTMCRPSLERISRVTFDPLGTGVQTSLERDQCWSSFLNQAGSQDKTTTKS